MTVPLVIPLRPSQERWCSKNMRWELEYVETTTEKMWMCWEPVHERMHLGGLSRLPRAIVLTKDVSGTAVAGELGWHLALYRRLGTGWQAGSHQFWVGLSSLRKQKQARSSRPAAAAAGGRAEKGGSVDSSSPGGQVQAAPAQRRQDPLQRGHFQVFPGLRLL